MVCAQYIIQYRISLESVDSIVSISIPSVIVRTNVNVAGAGKSKERRTAGRPVAPVDEEVGVAQNAKRACVV